MKGLWFMVGIVLAVAIAAWFELEDTRKRAEPRQISPKIRGGAIGCWLWATRCWLIADSR